MIARLQDVKGVKKDFFLGFAISDSLPSPNSVLSHPFAQGEWRGRRESEKGKDT